MTCSRTRLSTRVARTFSRPPFFCVSICPIVRAAWSTAQARQQAGDSLLLPSDRLGQSTRGRQQLQGCMRIAMDTLRPEPFLQSFPALLCFAQGWSRLCDLLCRSGPPRLPYFQSPGAWLRLHIRLQATDSEASRFNGPSGGSLTCCQQLHLLLSFLR